MLKSLDVLIGLVVVLLALSMAVTVVTQALTAIVNSRGRHLKRGLQDLLQQLDPALTATISEAIATKVLTHPLVSGSTAPSWLQRLRRRCALRKRHPPRGVHQAADGPRPAAKAR